jgi:hypothetical protein
MCAVAFAALAHYVARRKTYTDAIAVVVVELKSKSLCHCLIAFLAFDCHCRPAGAEQPWRSRDSATQVNYLYVVRELTAREVQSRLESSIISVLHLGPWRDITLAVLSDDAQKCSDCARLKVAVAVVVSDFDAG